MRGIALLGVVGSAAAVTIGVMVGRDRMAAAQANIRRYSMPGPRSYDLAARLLFDDRYRAIAAAIAAEVPEGSRLLDVGCGPGEVLARLATIAPRIETTGLDVDASMIELAERKADRAAARGAATRPTFVIADAATMPFADASFDVVVSSFAVHHWPDREAGLGEIMRVLRPGGRAIIWDIAPPHAAPVEGDADAADDGRAPSQGEGHGIHGEGSGGHVAGHAVHGGGHVGDVTGSRAPRPSFIRTLRMLILFRRISAQRFDFVKPGT
jgi:ubiquinone/menaquinone biosynthesis C-methylase UbiE